MRLMSGFISSFANDLSFQARELRESYLIVPQNSSITCVIPKNPARLIAFAIPSTVLSGKTQMCTARKGIAGESCTSADSM